MSSPLHCPEDAALWRALDARPLPPATAQHLHGCALCRERLQRLREERTVLRRLHRQPPSAEQPRAADDDSGRPVEAAAADLPPERIGRYPLTARIGGGGQAEVFRALHPTLGCSVMIKRARTSLRPDDEARWSILREGRILAAIDEPVLARVLDLDFHEDRPFLVLEDVAGETLTQVARREPLTDADIADLLYMLARGVQAAHEAGVLHLDLKPDNVLVTPDGRPRLIDFGAALLHRAHGAAAVDGWVVGTPPYMAPEQHAGDPTLLTPRTDVYGLGGILHFLLYGVAPHAASFGELPTASAAPAGPALQGGGSLSGSVQTGSPLRRRLAAIAHRALAEHPLARFTDAAEMAVALDRARRGGRKLHRLIAAALCLAASAACAVWCCGAASPFAWPGDSLSLCAEVEVDGDVRPLTQALPFAPGSAVRVDVATPAPEQTRLFLVWQDGRVIHCQPLSCTMFPGGAVGFPPEERLWQVRGLPEFNLLLAGINLAGPVPTHEEIERALESVRLRLSAGEDWLVVSDGVSDPHRVIRESWAQARALPERNAGAEPRPEEGMEDETAQVARELCAALDQVFDRYQAVLFRCGTKSPRPDSAAVARPGEVAQPAAASSRRRG